MPPRDRLVPTLGAYPMDVAWHLEDAEVEATAARTDLGEACGEEAADGESAESGQSGRVGHADGGEAALRMRRGEQANHAEQRSSAAPQAPHRQPAGRAQPAQPARPEPPVGVRDGVGRVGVGNSPRHQSASRS